LRAGLARAASGMAVITQDWGDAVLVLGEMYILVGLACLGLWVLLAGRTFVESRFRKEHLREDNSILEFRTFLQAAYGRRERLDLAGQGTWKDAVLGSKQ